MSSVGVLVSLNAPTARAAYQKLSLVMLAFWFLPMLALNVIPEEVQPQINQFINSINLIQVATLGIVIILALDALVIVIAQRKFKRTRLILD
jgi:ABC-2 type transport system permease protein